MSFATIQFNMGAGTQQPQIIELLKRERRDYIQTSNGLCVKGSPEELKELFTKNAINDVNVTTIEKNPTPDIQAFIQGRGL